MATFEDLAIERLIVHEVVLASALNGEVAPLMSTATIQLDQAGARLVSRRVAEALGTDSHSVEVGISEEGDGSAFQMCSSLLDADEAQFVATSQRLANNLSRSQNVGSIKGGIVLIFQAQAGPMNERRRLLVIVKAESDSAFIKENLRTGVSLKFVNEMVLGAQQRLFKIGAFIETRRRPGTPRQNWRRVLTRPRNGTTPRAARRNRCAALQMRLRGREAFLPSAHAARFSDAGAFIRALLDFRTCRSAGAG